MTPRFATPSKGFALVLVLALLSLAVLVVIALAALSRSSAAIANSSAHHVQARQNALLGLGIALGELQKHAGPDARLTTSASFLTDTRGENSNWTAVWTIEPELLTWLVSGSANPSTFDPQIEFTSDSPRIVRTKSVNNVVLVAGGTISTASTGYEAGDAVIVPKVGIGYPTSSSDGSYAYWIGDNGLKISAAPTDISRSTLASARVAYADPQRIYNNLSISRTDRERLVSHSQLELVNPANTSLKDYFHKLTLNSKSVAVDVRTGSLKTDLSAHPAALVALANPFRQNDLWGYDSLFFGDLPAVHTNPNNLRIPPLQMYESGGRAWAMVSGSLNINNRSTETWRALLETAATKHWVTASGNFGSRNYSSRLGQLVGQIVQRMPNAFPPFKNANTPFSSLENFARSGLLDQAIQSSGINSAAQLAGLPPEARLTGDDLLAIAGQLMSVRSDSFIIRAYGESSLNDQGLPHATSWVEAYVQRVPDFVDASQTPDTPREFLNVTNSTLGRRFVITYFRWLTPADI